MILPRWTLIIALIEYALSFCALFAVYQSRGFLIFVQHGAYMEHLDTAEGCKVDIIPYWHVPNASIDINA